MKLDFDAFLDTLPVMAKGMAGIFIVTCAIVLSMVILNKLATKKPEEKKKEQ